MPAPAATAATDASPHITSAPHPDGVWLSLHGRWGAAQLASRAGWQHAQAQLTAHPAASDTGWDLTTAAWLDHTGAQLLWRHWQRQWPSRLLATDGQLAMLQRVAHFTAIAPAPRPTRPRGGWGGWAMRRINHLGLLVLHALGHMRHFVQMLGELVLNLLQVLRRPRRAPWRDFSGHLYGMGTTALPITALVGFLIGVVLAYLMALQLSQFGAQAFIVNILGISLIRELGPLLAAILVAGRSGSAITAQIGVMRVTEELDAMRVMGIAHSYRLVMPRALALGVAMPLVSLWTTLAALAGGMLAADLVLDISPAYFVQTLPSVVQAGNLGLAVGKSVVFGICIALIACHWGLRVQPNTQSLGAGTTASVVSSITMVIVVDALFAIAFRNVGF